MSIDKSLKRTGGMNRTRSVMTRAERIEKMMENGSYKADQSPFGIPKTRVVKVVLRKKAKKEAAAEGATPAAGGDAKAADAKGGKK
jgi:small basic protein (TIGR04137 family)